MTAACAAIAVPLWIGFPSRNRFDRAVIVVEIISKDDDLTKLAEEINSAQWDEANEISQYDTAALWEYLNHQGTVFLACHEVVDGGRQWHGQ